MMRTEFWLLSCLLAVLYPAAALPKTWSCCCRTMRGTLVKFR
jgi:hypothetical protein